MPESKFPKPVGGLPARGDASAFLNRDFGSPASIPPERQPAEQPPGLVVPPVRRGRPRAGEMKIPITYKHRESNFRILKKISQRLEIPIGDLLDEAIETRLPEWKARIAELPPDSLF
jgi:hypothetical protein